MSTILSLLKSPNYQKKSVLEKLICHRLGITKTQLFASSEQEIIATDQQRIDTAYTAYISEHKPLEYILGYVPFADLKFQVNKNTLIPRPETEYMIDAVREYIQVLPSPPTPLPKGEGGLTLLDIGTGCGVLGVSILHHCGKHISQAVLADLSSDALEIAKKNYDTHIGTSRTGQDQLLVSNLLDHPDIHTLLFTKNSTLKTQDCIIIANLPYIPDNLFDKNADPTVHNREPRMAFVGGNDGLDLYRVMFDQLLSQQANKCIFFLEMMTRQVDILRKEYANRDFEEIKTFHFNIRIVRVIVGQEN